jgi:hypothetical protein
LAPKNLKLLYSQKRKVEIMISAIGVNNMSERQKIYAEQVFRSIRHLEKHFVTSISNYTEDLINLEQSLLYPTQTSLLSQLDDAEPCALPAPEVDATSEDDDSFPF